VKKFDDKGNMNQRKITYILKLATQYEQNSRKFFKKANYLKAIQGISNAVLIISPIMKTVMGLINGNSALAETANSLLENLNTYKSSYGFEKHDSLLSEYMANLNKFKNSFSEVNNIKDLQDSRLPDLLKTIIDSGEFLILHTSEVSRAIESMKSTGGKIFDALKYMDLSFGAETASTNIIEKSGQLSALLDQAFPEIKSKYNDLMSAAENYVKSNNEETGSETTNISSEMPEEDFLSQLGNLSI
jgi:hypothetical protein